nr:GxxExxY protein [Rhodopirellula sp. SWK7]
MRVPADPVLLSKTIPTFLSWKRTQAKIVPDFICYGKVILEIKAVRKLTDEHRSQVINYLNATGYALGVLVNFGGHPSLEWERFALTKKT